MDTNNLNILYYLVYVEIILLVLGLIRTVLNFIVGIIMSIFNVIEYKQDNFMILTEIPLMILLLFTTTHLAYINTIDSSLGIKILFYASTAMSLLIFRLLYQKDIYELASKENNLLLRYYSEKYFRISFWTFLILFLFLIFGPFKGDNPISTLCINIVHWALNIKVIGSAILWLAGVLFIGTLYMTISFGLVLISGKKYRS